MVLIEFRKKSQITLPKEIVEGLDLKYGDLLQAELEGDAIKLRPVEIVPKSEMKNKKRKGE